VTYDEREGELRCLLAEVTRKEISSAATGDDLVRELGLDSLTGLEVLAAVEKRFGVRFPDDRLDEFRSIADLMEVIAGEECGRP
jgi:acyl carrier protein